jgi:hypothetical protein
MKPSTICESSPNRFMVPPPGAAFLHFAHAWAKLAENIPSVPMMNEYLEKVHPASWVCKRVCVQAMQMFSAFPYTGMSGML